MSKADGMILTPEPIQTRPMIYSAIRNVMKEIGAIGKNSKNMQQGFMFRGIDAVMNGIQPALINNGVFLVPEVLEQTREERQSFKGGNLIYSICKIRYTFFAQDGSSIEATVIGEGMDSGDKATNKAMSIAFKYACFQVFCIPTEEMAEPDAEVHEVKPKAKKEEKKQEPAVQHIDAKDIADLSIKMETDCIHVETLLKLYKVAALEDLTRNQLENIYAHWDKIIDIEAGKA